MENDMTRRAFVGSALGCAAAGLLRADDAAAKTDRGSASLDLFQREIDKVAPADYKAFLDGGPGLSDADRLDAYGRFTALRRYDAAFEKVRREAKETVVADRPAVWFVYNMGIVVKTPQTLFSIDLHHRLAESLASELDFALITHNHGDHYTDRFYRAMDKAQHRTVVTNFLDNYGAHRVGGYTHGPKTFEFGDVTVRTTLSDHNSYLVDFTMPFEISIGDFTLYHTGDSSNIAKLNPARRPDLWLVHPRCGLDVAAGVRKFAPKRTGIVHINELQHAIGRWRWSFSDGMENVAKANEAGTEAFMPLWGERIC